MCLSDGGAAAAAYLYALPRREFLDGEIEAIFGLLEQYPKPQTLPELAWWLDGIFCRGSD